MADTLHVAARAHDLLGVCGALASGILPSHRSADGLTALMLACSSPVPHLQEAAANAVVAMLLSGDGRAEIDARCQAGGFSALMFAAGCGSTSIVQTLIEAGAALELLDDDGNTAWTKARYGGHNAVVAALEGAGARRSELATPFGGQLQTMPLPHVEGSRCSATRFDAQFRGRQAVVLKGAASHWAACRTWAQRSTLEARLGGTGWEALPCRTIPDGRRVVPSEAALGTGRIGEVLDALALDGGPSAATEGAPHVHCQLGLSDALLHDVADLDGLPSDHAGHASESRVSFASEGTETALHLRPAHAYLIQVVGRRRLVVFPSSEHAHLYPYSSSDGDPLTSRVDLAAWRRGDAAETHQWPCVARSFGHEGILCPGDVAYVPAGHWHFAVALSPSISVLRPFAPSAAEHSQLPKPWMNTDWGRVSRPVCRPNGLRRALLLPEVEAAALNRRLGADIWPAAFVLANELQMDPWRALLSGTGGQADGPAGGRTVLELGAGATGFPGMVAALCGSEHTRVVLTDKHPDLVAGLQQRLHDNGLASQCVAQVYAWGTDAPPTPLSATAYFDLILASDCLYSHETAGYFCDALDELCGAHTRVLVSAEERWSRRECVEIAHEKGWIFKLLSDERRPSEAQLECIEARMKEMGEGRWFLYDVTRAHPRRSPPARLAALEVATQAAPTPLPSSPPPPAATPPPLSPPSAATPPPPSAQAMVLYDATQSHLTHTPPVRPEAAALEATFSAAPQAAPTPPMPPMPTPTPPRPAATPLPPSACQPTQAACQPTRVPSFMLEPNVTFAEATTRLLASRYTEATGEWTSTEGSYTALLAADCTMRHMEPCAPCFDSHDAITLPDALPPLSVRPPGQTVAPGVSEIHRFVLRASIAQQVNEQLLTDAAVRMGSERGIRRSNQGGFHSEEVVFTGTSSDWYGRLHNVLLEALRMLEASEAAAAPPIAEADAARSPVFSSCTPITKMRMSGWMNVCDATDFHTLHDHGEALWAVVYFVQVIAVDLNPDWPGTCAVLVADFHWPRLCTGRRGPRRGGVRARPHRRHLRRCARAQDPIPAVEG